MCAFNNSWEGKTLTSFQTQVRGVKLYSLSECGTTQAVHVKVCKEGGNRRDKKKKLWMVRVTGLAVNDA